VGGTLSHAVWRHQRGLTATQHANAVEDGATCPLWHAGAANVTAAIAVSHWDNTCLVVERLLPAANANGCTPNDAPKAPVCTVLERLLPSARDTHCSANQAPKGPVCSIVAQLLPDVTDTNCLAVDAPRAPACSVVAPLFACPSTATAKPGPVCNVLAQLLPACPIGSQRRTPKRSLLAATVNRLVNLNRRVTVRSRRACRALATAASGVERVHVVAAGSLLAHVACVALVVSRHRRDTLR
jgi:hypothetical protein